MNNLSENMNQIAERKLAAKKCKVLAALIEILFGVEVSFALRLRTSWIVLYRNSKGEEYTVYWQLSLKNPWWIPRYNPEFGKGQQPLYGWLFFYFGKHREK